MQTKHSYIQLFFAKLIDPFDSLLWQNLNEESRKQWELICSGKELETLDEPKDFVTKLVRALESYTDTLETNKISHEKYFRKTNSSFPHSYKTGLATYPGCSENNKLFMCKNVEELSIKDRKNVTYTSKLCFNCLSKDRESKRTS